MAASARMSTHWALRMGLVSAAFGAFGLWCLLDATVGYPRFNQRAAEHNRLLTAGEADRWPARAAEGGWSTQFGEEDRLPSGAIRMKTRWDSGTQYVMVSGCLAVVVVLMSRFLRARRRTMAATDDGFRTVEGLRVPYANITEIDLRRWQRKSIARVHFRQGGQPLITEVDDWIYQGGEAVLAELQRRTGLGVPSAPQAAATAAAVQPQDPSTRAGTTEGRPDASAS